MARRQILNSESIQLFSPQYEVDECIEALRSVLESGWTGCGPACRRFEAEWSSFTKGKYSHYVNSATAALHIALRLCDLPKQSYVLSTPLTFVSTNAVILYEDHIPVFVDINEDDFSLNAADFFEKKERYKAKASMWVHYAGNVSSHFYKVREALQKEREGLFQLIEDCAHASGAFYRDGEPVGSLADTFSCFSYHSVKNLPTFDSGMLCSGSETTIQRAKKLSWLGIDKDTYSRTNSEQNEVYKWRYDVPELGWKYNSNDIAATLATVQLKYLMRDNAYRRQIYEWYKENFSAYPHIRLMLHEKGSSHHLLVVRIKNRDEVIAKLKSEGIAPGVHYLPNCYFPVFKKYYKKGDCPILETVSEELMSLPNHLRLTRDDIDWICEVISESAQS